MVAVLESLGKEDGDVVDYIRYYWVMSHGKTRNSVLFDNLKDEVNSEPTVAKWISGLEATANEYAALLTSSHQAWSGYHKEIRAKIEILRFLKASQLRPLLMAAYKKFTRKDMENLLILSVNWSVRCLISGVTSNTLEDHCSKNSKKVTDGLIKDLKELMSEMAAIVPNDDRFKAAASTTIVQTTSLARYYLRRLQMEEDGNVEPQYVPNNGKAVTLEHVLPQRPGKGWKHILPEDAKANYNRLGNQALLGDTANNGLGNEEFSTKRPILALSPFSLTKSIAKVKTDWTIKDISDRQARLAALAVKAWPLTV